MIEKPNRNMENRLTNAVLSKSRYPSASWRHHAAHISHKPTFLPTLSGIVGASACISESRVGKRRGAPSVIRADTSSWKVGLFDAVPHGAVANSHRELVSQRGKPEEAV